MNCNAFFKMDFLKISLWLFLAISSVHNSKCKSLQKYQIHNTRKTTNEFNDNCFCFKNSGVHHKVPEILTQDKDNLERLIVYLYKDKPTGLIKMYIPNDEKQALVPNLAFEVGDKLVTVEDEKIKDIFTRDANRNEGHLPNEVTKDESTIKTTLPHEYVDYEQHIDTDGLLKPYNTELDENVQNNFREPHISEHGEPHVDETNVLSEITLPGKVIFNSDISFDAKIPSSINAFVEGKPFSNWNILPEFNYHDQSIQPNFNTDITATELNVPTGVVNIEEDKHHVTFEQGIPSLPSQTSESSFVVPGSDWSILPEYSHLFELHNQGKYPYFVHGDIERPTHVDKIVYSEHLNTSKESKSEEEIELSTETVTKVSEENMEIESNLEENVNIEKDVSEEIEYSSESRSSEDSLPTESDTSNEIEWDVQRKSSEIIDVLDTKPTLNHNQYETFDRWFIQQMQRFRTYTEHDRAINLATIERYILKILHDNGMHVTTEGVLTDSFGTALDIHNLHLRPILIGKPLAFGSLMNENAADLVMPANLAYLQAILVTNANPSMILGIIPIGKTVIPPSAINAFSTLLKPHIKYASSRPIRLHHLKRLNIKKNPKILQLSKLESGGLKNHGKTIVTVVKKTPVIVKAIHRHRQPVKTVKVFKGSREYSFVTDNSKEAVNKLLLSLRHDIDSQENSADATNKLLEALRTNGSLPSFLDEGIEVESLEEDIEGRIVGGSAATGSGAPLNMKGRMKDF